MDIQSQSEKESETTNFVPSVTEPKRRGRPKKEDVQPVVNSPQDKTPKSTPVRQNPVTMNGPSNGTGGAPSMQLGQAETQKPEQKMVSISEDQWNDVQKQLKMLYEVADKGRIFNYESQRTQKKPFRVKLSLFRDKIITGWRTVKDKAVYHPTTGKQVGEEQEYELMLLNHESKVELATVAGYPSFSEARYGERIECEVIGKKEDFEGNVTFEVSLPDGRVISLNARFVN